MPKLPSSAGSPRLNSPGLGASPHVGRRPSPLSRSNSQTTTILERSGSIGQPNDAPKINVVARVAPSQLPSTNKAPPNHPADLGQQSSPSNMQIVDPDPLPSQSSRTPSVLKIITAKVNCPLQLAAPTRLCLKLRRRIQAHLHLRTWATSMVLVWTPWTPTPLLYKTIEFPSALKGMGKTNSLSQLATSIKLLLKHRRRIQGHLHPSPFRQGFRRLMSSVSPSLGINPKVSFKGSISLKID